MSCPHPIHGVSYTYVCTHPKDDSTCDHCDIQDSYCLKKASCAARMADGNSERQDVAAATEHSEGGRNKMSAGTSFTPPTPTIAPEPANQVALAAATEPSVSTPLASLLEAEIATAENASTAAAATAAATEHRQDYQPPAYRCGVCKQVWNVGSTMPHNGLHCGKELEDLTDIPHPASCRRAPANQVPLAAATDPSIFTPANSSSGLSGVAEHVPVVVPAQMSAAPAAPAVAAASATSTLPTASAASDGATEHVASTTQQTTLLLTVDDLPAWRESLYGSHKEARAVLQQLTRQPEADVIDLEMIWENWQAYIAKHPKSEEIVGSGIVSLKAKRIPHSSDPNNFAEKRLDFFVYRLDGSAARLHPGTTRKTMQLL